MTDRGQTEVVGYLLVFSAILLTVALVTVSGQAGLVELRDAQRTENVEAGFSVLASNIDDVHQNGVESRATELDLSGGSLGFGAPVSVTVTAEENATGEVFSRTRTVRPIVYRSPSGATLAYALGAVVIRGEDGGTAMLREPRMVLSAARTIVPVANTTLDRRQLRGRSGSVTSESRVLVRTERVRTTRLASVESTVTLNLTVASPRAPAWVPYLEAEIDEDDCSLGAGRVSCTYRTDRAAVVLTRIAVSFE